MANMEEKVKKLNLNLTLSKRTCSKKIANGKTDYNKSTNNNDDAIQSKLDVIAALRKII